jgi:3-methylcrotonyl-CoA carboxylase alpha subunit
VDTGVEQGDEITPHYDPMIAKLIVWGADRHQALARMRQALAQYRIVGVGNNVDFLARLVAVPAFANADLDTGLIEREQALLFPEAGTAPQEVWMLAALAETLRDAQLADKKAQASADRHSPWRATDGWRLNGTAQRKLKLRLGEVTQEIGIRTVPQGHEIDIDGHCVFARGTLAPDSELHAQLGERRLRAAVVASGERRHVFFEGRAWPLVRVDTLHVGGGGDTHDGGLRAPMPGKVIALLVAAGAAVEKGTPLLVMEAMKMEHTITAPRKGIVKTFHCAPGEQVGDGAELVELDPAATK